MRRVASIVLLVVAGFLFPLVVVANWAGSTLFDSDTFSERAVEPLNSQDVRKELARRLTEQLVRAGNQQAVNFRPAFELALEGVIDSDTFRAIFRNAVRRTHEAILAGQGGGQGIDLGASFAIITQSLQVSGGAGNAQQGQKGLNNSLTDVTDRLNDLGIWDLEDTAGKIATAALFTGLAAAAGSILLSENRRRATRRLGFATIAGGLSIVVVLLVANWFVGRQIDDPRLAGAITGALGQVTDDLRLTGLWIAAYGVVLAAAAAPSGNRYTPPEVWRRARGWVERRRATTWGTVLLAVIAIFISIIFIQDPLGNFELLIRAAALWMGYLGIAEILRLVQTITAQTKERRSVWPRIAVIGGTIVVIVSLVTFGFILTTRGAAKAAERSGEQVCNGKKSLCDLRIDQVTFPGAHNAMSSSLYSGYLFAEHINTISDQLKSGVRAFLIDTYYGVPSSARIPGTDTSIVLTDRVATEAARVAGKAEVNEDPVAAKRASDLAGRATPAANAQRGIYLCHNRCETGAVPFSTALNDFKVFLDTHPDDVVMTILQDATDPADTAAAIEAAGLSNRVATLRPGEPLPTLRQMIESGRTLLVFAERGDPGGPPWYHSAYDWFQETTYTFPNKKAFNCQPNRGAPTAPLFLINHWVSTSPPDPAIGGAANARAVLEQRVDQCLTERGISPTVIAVDFAESGDLVSTVSSINERRLKEERAKRLVPPDTQPPAEQPPNGTAPPPPEATPLSRLPEPTLITTLTGGNPARFCRVLPSTNLSVSAWAVAILDNAPAETGLTDFAYGPLLARDVKAFVDVAPEELAPRAAPILARARDAVARLQALGLTARDIKQLADAASDDLLSPKSPDGLKVRADLVKKVEKKLAKKVDPDALRQAAAEFAGSQADPATLLDLGNVPTEVGVAAGYPCAAGP
jgi:hypothetical protein